MNFNSWEELNNTLPNPTEREKEFARRFYNVIEGLIRENKDNYIDILSSKDFLMKFIVENYNISEVIVKRLIKQYLSKTNFYSHFKFLKELYPCTKENYIYTIKELLKLSPKHYTSIIPSDLLSEEGKCHITNFMINELHQEKIVIKELIYQIYYSFYYSSTIEDDMLSIKVEPWYHFFYKISKPLYDTLHDEIFFTRCSPHSKIVVLINLFNDYFTEEDRDYIVSKFNTTKFISENHFKIIYKQFIKNETNPNRLEKLNSLLLLEELKEG